MRLASAPVLLLIAALGFRASAAAATIEALPTGTAGFVGLSRDGPFDTPTPVTSLEEFEGTFGGYDPDLSNPYLAPSVAAFFLNGGERCYVVRVELDADDSYIGLDGPPRTGLQSLRDVDEVSLVCLPGVTSAVVQGAMIAQCEELRDRFAILDCERSADSASVQVERQGLASAQGFAALYFPWVQVDPQQLGADMIPPSGFVAGTCARVDREAGVWKSPIGGVLGAVGLGQEVTDQAGDELNLAGISVLRAFPGQGIRIWGARTISPDSDWKYVSVRRFATFLEHSIDKGTQWAVFEGNDETLWAKLSRCVEEFLLGLWRDGALQGARPDQAFFVKADRTTMTQDDIDQGRTIVLVGVAVVRPAEFVILRIEHDRLPAPAPFLRGDVNSDGGFDISDAVAVLDYLFVGTTTPGCLSAADIDASGSVDLSDAVFGLSFLFLGGPAPPAPYPSCAPDPGEVGTCASSCP